jgi:hypothetical protein
LRWDEYKLLQDKLDRIGDFKFRVKTWVASLTGLFVVGSEAIKAGWWGAICGTALVPLFWCLERYYKQLEDALGTRLRVLERELQRGEFLALPQASKKRLRRSVAPRIVEAVNLAFSRKRTGPERLVRWAHEAFYVVLLAVPALAVALRHESESDTGKAMYCSCLSATFCGERPASAPAAPVADESTPERLPTKRIQEGLPSPDASAQEGDK